MDPGVIPLPGGQLPPAMLFLRWAEAMRRAHPDAVPVLDRLVAGNGALPDLLRLAGHPRVDLAEATESFIWEGWGGARVQVGSGSGAAVHTGELEAADRPAADPGAGDGGIHALVDLARWEDAGSLLATAAGSAHAADWQPILVALAAGGVERLPPLAARLGHPEGADATWGAWNPLPFARRLIAALPAGAETPPWSLLDADGARYPVQVAEGAFGRELLVPLELGALECRRLLPGTEMVDAAHWEVAPEVLDNGIVRAEFDRVGQLTRLCWDGVFADLAGPAVVPAYIGGDADAPEPDISVACLVLEAGPVRARVAVTRSGPAGTLRIVYTLHAHDDVLRVSATWSGSGGLVLVHPTAARASALVVADEVGRRVLGATARRDGPRESVPGVRWAAFADGAGNGLAVCSPRPITVRAEAGTLEVLAGHSCTYALANARRPRGALNLGCLAATLAQPGRPFAGGQSLPPPMRLAGGTGLVPLWARRPADARGEILFAEQSGARGRAWIHPDACTDATDAWRTDVQGTRGASLPRTPERDGFQLDFQANEVFLVRWA